MDIREISVPQLQALSDAPTGFTVNMAILDGPDVVQHRALPDVPFRATADRPQPARRLPTAGGHCTGLVPAFLPEERFEEILDQADLVERGPNTILTGGCALRSEMERVRMGWP